MAISNKASAPRATAKRPTAKTAVLKATAKRPVVKAAPKSTATRATAKTAKTKTAAPKATVKTATTSRIAALKATAKKATTKLAAKITTTAKAAVAKSKPTATTTKKSSTSRVASPKMKSARKPNAAFMKPLNPSKELAEVVGSAPIPRTEVMKKVWAYIKKHDLQDTKNRRAINADDKLKAVFGGKKQVTMFEMTKLVSNHLK